MVEEVIPGLVHWSTFHEGIGHEVHSAFDLETGTLVDPMEPEERLAALAALGTPHRIVLSNRHHYRHSARFVERFGCPVLCHRAGLDHFAEEHTVDGFEFGDELAPGVRALELGAICPEETTIALARAGVGALCFGDGVTRDENGALAFMPDGLLGENPEKVKQGLRRNLRTMLPEDFDVLLLAHAEPVLSGAKALLEQFVENP